jgi:hypothetical protein
MKLVENLVNNVNRSKQVLWIHLPILHLCQWGVLKWRQVYEISLGQILHIEEILEPLLH